jgi:hypothetical protein
MLVRVSRQAALHGSASKALVLGTTLGGKRSGIGQVSWPSKSLPVTCQASTQTDSVLHVWHYVITRGFTTVERPNPMIFPFLSVHRHIGDSNSCPPDLELGFLTKWLASWRLVSKQASHHLLFFQQSWLLLTEDRLSARSPWASLLDGLRTGAPPPLLYRQCSGSTCFWASRIRIH